MLKIRGWSVAVLALALVAGPCFAQEAQPAKFFKLDFVVKEVEGAKVLNARTYSLTVSTGTQKVPSSIRTGSKVPVRIGGQIATSAQYTYFDVGVNIDCHEVTVEAGQLSLHVEASISSLMQDTPTYEHPVIRENKWFSAVIVPLKKPTVIFSSDDLTSNHQMQLELTATPIT